MRALHLAYLRGPGGKKLRYYPTEFEPMIIPWWFSSEDRERILAFYQQILSDEPLMRIEVDWYHEFVLTDRAFLQHMTERRNTTEYLLVVRVCRGDVNLQHVLTHPDLQPFQHVAVTSDHWLVNENFGQISELTGFVTQTIDYVYEEMLPEFSLREDGSELLRALVQTLLNPILVVEAYNALIDVQTERVDPVEHRDTVYRRILLQLLKNLTPHEAIGVSAFALRGRDGFDLAFGEAEQPSVLASLRSRLLLVDNRLTRWAQLLCLPEFKNVLTEWNREEYQHRVPSPSGIRVTGWLKNKASLSRSIKNSTKLKNRPPLETFLKVERRSKP